MATKLKNLQLTSVDLVRAGANQEADICLYKSADEVEPDDSTDESENKVLKKFVDMLKKAFAEPKEEIEKKSDSEPEERTFDEVQDGKKANETLEFYLEALEDSFISIQMADELSTAKKKDMMKQSLEEFNEAMKDLIPDLAETAPWEEETKKSADLDEIEEV